MDVAFLYLHAPPIAADLRAFGLWFGLRSAVNAFALGLVMPAAKTMASVDDGVLCALGLASKAAALTVMGLAVSIFIVYLEVVVGALSALALASIRAMLSKSVSQAEQGNEGILLLV
jgi:hypothetical protein